MILFPLSQVVANPYQARKDYGDVSSLASDILAHLTGLPDTRGLMAVPGARFFMVSGGQRLPLPTSALQNLVSIPPTMQAELAWGHRRWQAFLHLASFCSEYEDGLIPLLPVDATDVEMLNYVFVENHARK